MNTESSPTLEQYRAAAEFRYQLRRFLWASEQNARTHHLEPQHYQLLMAIKGLPEGQQATITTLAERMQLRHHSVVELVNRLVDQKLAIRVRGKRGHDHRLVFIHLTPEGEDILRTIFLAGIPEMLTRGSILISTLTLLLQSLS